MSSFVRNSAALLLLLTATHIVSLAETHDDALEHEAHPDSDHDHGHGGHGDEHQTDPGVRAIEGLMRSKAQKREKIPSFRSQENLMRRMCALMEDQGRRSEWFAIIEQTLMNPPEPIGAWRNLLKSWSSSCRPVTKRAAKPKKTARQDEESEPAEEDVVTPVPTVVATKRPDLTPDTELLELASEWSIATSNSMAEMPDAREAVRSMLQLLRPVPQPKKTPTVEMGSGSRIYFDVLAEYLTAPWGRMFAEEDRKARREGMERGELDDLFDDR